MQATFTAPLWLYPGDAGWYFVTLPPHLADDIHDTPAQERRGFGSRRVEVTVGSTTWRTSIFPDMESGSFLLPVKADVRKQEQLDDGDPVRSAGG